MAKRKNYRPYSKARDHVRGLRLTGRKDWLKYRKSGKLPPDIPVDPYTAYRRRGEWISWGDFLGTGNTRNQDKKFVPWPKAREFARGLGLESKEDWSRHWESNKKPPNIPADPAHYYSKTGEWTNWGDFLGTGNLRPRDMEFALWPEARELARGLGLEGKEAWSRHWESNKKPPNIPRNPAHWYKKTGEWTNWGDFLGTGNIHPQDKTFALWPKAREIARGLELKSQVEWVELCKSGERPQDIPSNPDTYYGRTGEWTNWPDFLGHAPNKWTRVVLLNFLKGLRPSLPYLTEGGLYAILSQQGGSMPALTKKFSKNSPLEVLKDIRENEARGVEEAIRRSQEDEEEAPPGVSDLVVAGDVAERIAAGEEPVTAVDGDSLPTLVSAKGLRVIDDLTNEYPGGLADEVAEYLVVERVAALWDAWIKGEDTTKDLAGDGGYYFNLIRERFASERKEVEVLPVPEGWSFTPNGTGEVQEPLPMQKRTAWEVLTKKRVGNWSGAGAGKTNAAILTSRVCGCTNTLVVAANATVDGWCREIKNTFPDSVIHTKPTVPPPDTYNYTILNYEKFQQPDRGSLARRLKNLGYDFVVLDEVQFSKQRDGNKSYRRETLEALIYKLAEENPDLRVLGMSATPVINNLYEGRKLLEIVKGRSFGDLDHKPTLSNALAVHRALMVHGFRYKPDYEVEFGAPEVIETVRNDLLDELRTANGVLGMEQVLLAAKLEAIRPYIKRGTLIYTHYVNGMIYPTRQFLERMNVKVGVYTGEEKTGLEDFRKKRVDVLIGSQPVGTGVDGLQHVCDRIVILSPPWTGAEYEQLLGRIRRQGSAFSEVSIVWPQVVLEYGGDRWSWDRRRQQVIEYKRTLSDCAVDGNIPESLTISPGTLLRRSREALEEWIARVEGEGFALVERSKLEIPLPPDLKQRIRVKHGNYDEIGARWSRSNSTTVYERLSADPSEWYLYHTLYRERRAKWDEVPAEHIARQLSGRPDLRVGDFGCGECLLAAALPENEVVGLDYVAVNDSVIAGDMAHTPLEDGSLDAAVFSLSLLMGRNWPEYVEEARRVLKPYGFLFVAERVSRWEEENLEGAVAEHGFDVIRSEQRGKFRYVRAVKVD